MNGRTERQGEEQDDQPAEEALADEDRVEPEAVDDDGADKDAIPSIEELEARASENWDRYLRTAAELENVRKRSQRDVENARRYALERFTKELLAVKDSLEMGLAAENTTVESLHAGSAATLKLLATTLQQFGVKEVDPEGEPFDPEYHEAISMQPSDDAEPGSVLTVVQKGYSLNGRLLRPAMVTVAAD